jgi:hypothetical protein
MSVLKSNYHAGEFSAVRRRKSRKFRGERGVLHDDMYQYRYIAESKRILGVNSLMVLMNVSSRIMATVPTSVYEQICRLDSERARRPLLF